MKKRLYQLLTSFVLAFGAGLMLTAAPVGAVNPFDDACKGVSDSEICNSKKDNANTIIQNIVGILLWAIGAISVIMIIVGGIRYVISAGDASQIKAARETILYAIVGLVLALSSYAIVYFVLGFFHQR